MKLHEEFRIQQSPESLWEFFQQPEAVAACMPGVESVTVLDDDNVQVRATQSIGPMSATFEAKITVLERVPNELIRFRATGRSVRGAVGNLRAENSVRLRFDGEETTVVVDGDIILAGALGSVGQKVVAKQAGKATAVFAGNLQRALTGGPAAAKPPASTVAPRVPVTSAPDSPAPESGSEAVKWAKVAAGMSAVSVLISLVVAARQFGRSAR